MGSQARFKRSNGPHNSGSGKENETGAVRKKSDNTTRGKKEEEQDGHSTNWHQGGGKRGSEKGKGKEKREKAQARDRLSQTFFQVF